MSKYLKVRKDSETGKKFQALLDKADVAHEEVKAMCDKYGAREYRGSRFALWGGLSSLVFPNGNPDIRVWKKYRTGKYDSGREFCPRMDRKEGRAVQEEWDAMTMVRRNDLNALVGFHDPFMQACIGFDFNHPEYFGVTVLRKWKCRLNIDFTEITATQYDKLFKDDSDE